MVHCALCCILISSNVIGHKDSINFKIPHSLVIGFEHMYRIYLKATDHYIEHANLLRAFFQEKAQFVKMFYRSKFIVTYIFSVLKGFLRNSHYLVIFLVIFFCFLSPATSECSIIGPPDSSWSQHSSRIHFSRKLQWDSGRPFMIVQSH